MRAMPLFDLACTPPAAKRLKHHSSRHGHRRDDPYHWMQAPQSAAMQAHLLAENAYADAVMAPSQALQAKLYEEMLGRIQETDLSVPVQWQGAMYYTRTEAGPDYPIHCRTRIVDGLDALPSAHGVGHQAVEGGKRRRLIGGHFSD